MKTNTRILFAVVMIVLLPLLATLLFGLAVNESRQDVSWSLLMSIVLSVLNGISHFRAASRLAQNFARYAVANATGKAYLATGRIEPFLSSWRFVVKLVWAMLLSSMAFTFVLQRPSVLTLWFGPLMGMGLTNTAMYVLYTRWWRMEKVWKRA